mmetsp:Transcript_16359/g.18494  ORF Transcript_16359/g.18494 Transcript_16359/m.18494 type:complete len:157 (+) Transcript_16359:548-1018(+)
MNALGRVILDLLFFQENSRRAQVGIFGVNKREYPKKSNTHSVNFEFLIPEINFDMRSICIEFCIATDCFSTPLNVLGAKCQSHCAVLTCWFIYSHFQEFKTTRTIFLSCSSNIISSRVALSSDYNVLFNLTFPVFTFTSNVTYMFTLNLNFKFKTM